MASSTGCVSNIFWCVIYLIGRGFDSAARVARGAFTSSFADFCSLGLVVITNGSCKYIDRWRRHIKESFRGNLEKKKWIDMARIHISNSQNVENGKPARFYVLVASKGHAPFLSKRITFQESEEGMTELLRKLSQCIIRHDIKVVDDSNPKSTL